MQYTTKRLHTENIEEEKKFVMVVVFVCGQSF